MWLVDYHSLIENTISSRDSHYSWRPCMYTHKLVEYVYVQASIPKDLYVYAGLQHRVAHPTACCRSCLYKALEAFMFEWGFSFLPRAQGGQGGSGGDQGGVAAMHHQGAIDKRSPPSAVAEPTPAARCCRFPWSRWETRC